MNKGGWEKVCPTQDFLIRVVLNQQIPLAKEETHASKSYRAQEGT